MRNCRQVRVKWRLQKEQVQKEKARLREKDI